MSKVFLNKTICKSCKTSKPKIRSELRPPSTGKSRGWIYRDDSGYLWYGRVCGPCHDEKRRLRSHAVGTSKPREDVKHRTFSRAVITELHVKRLFENFGFEVVHTKGKGPDLVCSQGNRSLKVEVKSAIQINPRGGPYWRISPIKKKRMSDDIVASVLPDNTIYIESMSARLYKGLMLTSAIREANSGKRILGGISFVLSDVEQVLGVEP